MGLSAIIQDGAVVETASQSSVQQTTSRATNGNGMDKDAFLQLLVAQMKYQDPLQPTSNTEYISQYATFSQVEQMQNMAATMELSRASSMVGQIVEIQTTDSNGETETVQGKVDYVSYENNKAYVSIDGALYSADDVTAVVDEKYQTAYDLAVSFMSAMNELPALSDLNLAHLEQVEALQTGFNNMTAYQQSFVAEDYIEALQEYVERMSVLVEQAESENDAAADAEVVEDAEETGSQAVEEAEAAGNTGEEGKAEENSAAQEVEA